MPAAHTSRPCPSLESGGAPGRSSCPEAEAAKPGWPNFCPSPLGWCMACGGYRTRSLPEGPRGRRPLETNAPEPPSPAPPAKGQGSQSVAEDADWHWEAGASTWGFSPMPVQRGLQMGISDVNVGTAAPTTGVSVRPFQPLRLHLHSGHHAPQQGVLSPTRSTEGAEAQLVCCVAPGGSGLAEALRHHPRTGLGHRPGRMSPRDLQKDSPPQRPLPSAHCPAPTASSWACLSFGLS